MTPGILVATLLVTAQAMLAPSPAPASDVPRDVSADQLTRELADIHARFLTGDLTVAPADTLAGPIALLQGSLELGSGAFVSGDVWVVGGSVVMHDRAQIGGTLTLINSEVYATQTAGVGGLERLACACRLDVAAYRAQRRLVFAPEPRPGAAERDQPSPDASRWGLVIAPARPTRVRFDVLQLGAKYGNDARRDPHVQLRFTADVPVFPDTPHGFLEGEARAIVPISGEEWTLVLDGYKILHSEDIWQLNREENALLLVITSNEFANYYEKRGGRARVMWSPARGLGLSLSAFIQQDVSMPRSDVITIFGDKDDLPENPAIDDGVHGGAVLGVVYDTRIDRFYPRNAWRVGFELERGRVDPDSSGAADIDYTALTMVANRYSRLPWRIQWDIGARVFAAFDPVPYQRFQTLNGYGGVRGATDRPFDVVRGNRLAWLSTELRRELPDVPGFDLIYARWDFLVFGDIGLLAEVPAGDGPFDFIADLGGWIKTVGFGISGESYAPYLGIYFAQELDPQRPDPRVILRIARSF